MRVVVTGSSGLIGRALCSHLVGNGHDVVRVVRQPVRPDDRALQWDPQAGTIDASGLEGTDAVIHLAGAGIGDRRWSEARKRVLVESRSRSTALLASALAGLDRRPRVLVSASAIGFYGDRGDEVLSEQSPPGDDFLASLCVRWEADTAPAAEAGIRVICARTGIVLSRDGGALAKLLPLFKLGLGGRFGSGAQWWSWITLADEIRAMEWLLENDVHGPVNLTAPNPVTNREFTRVLGAVLSRPARLPVPRFGPRLLLGSEFADAMLFTSARVRPAVLESRGFVFSHSDLEAGLRKILSSHGS
jgi:uncharacterized protein (TIGR01777 family)